MFNVQVIILAAFVAVAIAAEIRPDYPAPPAAYPKEPVYVSTHSFNNTIIIYIASN